MDSICITCPDDWHLHVRDGGSLDSVVPHSARQFNRAIIMPNLVPPVESVDAALAYRRRILDAVPNGMKFNPLIALYLTEHTTPEDVQRASKAQHIIGFKLYPTGATTNSEAGVRNLEQLSKVFETMEYFDVPLLVHGEVANPEVDIFDREKIFIDRHLTKIVNRFTELRVTLEHATTEDAIQFVIDAGSRIAATLTPQHLLYNRNALFADGLNPHHYCLPVLKRERHHKALLAAATSGNPKFFLGTDSAPHPQSRKESACGCAGCYTAHAALELYTEIFETAGCLDKLEAFASFFGPDFYRLPKNKTRVTLKKIAWKIPLDYPLGTETLIPIKAGQKLNWRFIDKSETEPDQP